MAEPIAPVDTIDAALLTARDAIRELKKPQPGETAAEARQRSSETIKAQRRLIEASRKSVSDTVVAARKVGRANGKKATASAPQLTVIDGLEVCLKLAERALAEVRAAEKRIGELEAVPQLTDAGTWNAEKVFKPGNVVTHDGSAWVCQQINSNARPGQSDCWRLLVKRGRDAKGSR